MLRNDTDMRAISTERGFSGRYHVPFVLTTIHVTCVGLNSCSKDTSHYKQVLCEFYHLIKPGEMNHFTCGCRILLKQSNNQGKHCILWNQ